MGYDAIEYLQINGDCTLSGVHWGGRYYIIPYKTDFPDRKLRAGQRILMHAIPKGNRWNLDLLGRGDDILFHFNPRFRDKQIVRNSFKGGEWGREEREGPFPFEKNHGFNLEVENEPYSIQVSLRGVLLWVSVVYRTLTISLSSHLILNDLLHEQKFENFLQIFVNNERIGTFAHRTPHPTEDYTGMRIDGDVEVTNIEFV
ncbi:unnamed protein product [Cylicostephanus goldi]|uniref:Galectin n=1 Tax=Cylicostephanus goldi TaxID=71465 RepID=A0A3P7PHT9_CYLGO|nr:unnamed protein product [Cylicostephanus goldi]